MPGDDSTNILKLKKLLLQEEIDRLDRIEAQLDDPGAEAEKVSRVIAEAVAMRSGKDNMLSKALEPIVESSLRQNLQKRPQDYINILFPIIGSTIRKSISETFTSMLSSFSKGLETSFSLKGLRWRMEAMRSGKSYSEVAMLYTLVYSVDQAFLVHSETGLLLAHAVREGTESKDADMVSGMLTAIQDFAKDCFNKEGDQSALNSLKMDDYTVFIEQSPSVYIACVTRGTPPPEFPAKLRECIELILAEYREPLLHFTGDTTPFAGADKYLLDLLGAKFIDENKKLSKKIKAIPITMLVLLLLLFAYKSYYNYRMNKGVDLISEQQGVLLIDVKKYWRFKPWQVVILRDALAPRAEDILENNGLKKNLLTIRSIPFISYQPELIERRVISKLAIPPTATAVFENGALKLQGTADINWILDARQVALTTPGVLRVDTSDISDPRFDELQEMVTEIEKTRIRFPLGRALPIPEDADKLETAVNRLSELEKLAKRMRINVSLTVYGHADIVGSDKQNYEISLERAKTIAYMLYARGSHIPVSIFGMGASYASDSRESLESRKIELKVNLVPSAEGLYFK